MPRQSRANGPKESTTLKIDFSRDRKPFQDCKSEPRCAAYLGFQDIGSYRRFRFSLQVYLFWNSYNRGAKIGAALDLIWDSRINITAFTDLFLGMKVQS